jgi:hypothetical protein
VTNAKRFENERSRRRAEAAGAIVTLDSAVETANDANYANNNTRPSRLLSLGLYSIVRGSAGGEQLELDGPQVGGG